MIPKIIDIGKIVSEEGGGYITVAQVNEKVPFEIRRVYWTYYTPVGMIRGHHAHKKLHQIIISVSGTIHMHLESKEGVKSDFLLDHPSKGLYIPPGFWRTIEMSENAVLLCLASEGYNEDDYIRDYNVFKQV